MNYLKSYSKFPVILKKALSAWILLFAYVSAGFAQQINLNCSLDEVVKESSGLIFLKDRLITHTDSDGAPNLYEIDRNTGVILRSVEVMGASNIDWEDITYDESYIYIGDFGNNLGNRKDLKIYKIKISDYLETVDNKVQSEVIYFKYKNQVDFNPSPYDTNFDAETLINYKDKLYIFTKNWSNYNTNIYIIPKEPGDYDVEMINELPINGLISGGTYNPDSDKIILSGYTEDYAFVVSINNLGDDKFSNCTIERFDLDIPSPNSYQVEGITAIGDLGYFLSSESGVFGVGALLEMTFDNTLNLEQTYTLNDSIFPNPAKDYIHLQIKDYVYAEIFNSEGKKMISSDKKLIYIGDLTSGIYIVKAKTKNSELMKSFKLLKK